MYLPNARNFDCKDPDPSASDNTPSNPLEGPQGGVIAAVAIVCLLLLGGAGAGVFFVVRKYMYTQGKAKRVKPKKRTKKKKFTKLKDVVDNEEEIAALTKEIDEDEMDEDEMDGPMGTLLSN